MNNLFMLTGLLAMAPLSGAWAMQADGKAEVAQAGIGAVVSEAAAAGGLDEVKTRKLIKAIVLDNTFDPQEQDLVVELLKPLGTTVAVALPSGKSVLLPLPDAAGKTLLEWLVEPGKDLDTLWLKDEAAMSKIVEFYGWGGAVSNQVGMFVFKKLSQDWNNSSIGNSYQPLRDTLGKAWRLIKGFDLEKRRVGARLLQGAMKQLDQRASNSIPDYLYDWLNPTEEIVTKGGQ